MGKVWFFMTLMTCCHMVEAQWISGHGLDTARIRKGTAFLTEKYIGINPSNVPFNVLVSSIISNPDFIVDTTIARTDTSCFYLRGYFKTFNPFEMDFDSVKLVLADQVQSYSGSSYRDTVLLLQIFGNNFVTRYPDAVRTEFRRIDKEARKYFNRRYYGKTKKDNPVVGESYTYYHVLGQPIVRLSWGVDDTISGIILTYYLQIRRIFQQSAPAPKNSSNPSNSY